MYYPSTERHNAPYRGVSSKQDYVNFHLGATHDLLNIFNISGKNENIEGHEDIIDGNLTSVFEGEKEIKHVTYSAGTIKKVLEKKEALSNLENWTIPHMTYGQIRNTGQDSWEFTPPEIERGFFELEHIFHVSPGDKILIRFKIDEWNPDTVYRFGARFFDASGDNFKELEVTEWKTYSDNVDNYFEHTLRFDEERDVRMAIQTTNSQQGTLGESPLRIKEFGIYAIEEFDVYNRSLEKDIKPKIKSSQLTLKQIEERRL